MFMSAILKKTYHPQVTEKGKILEITDVWRVTIYIYTDVWRVTILLLFKMFQLRAHGLQISVNV